MLCSYIPVNSQTSVDKRIILIGSLELLSQISWPAVLRWEVRSLHDPPLVQVWLPGWRGQSDQTYINIDIRPYGRSVSQSVCGCIYP